MDLQTLAAALALAEKRGISQGDIDNQINDALAEIIAEEYSSTRSYALGSFCLREGKLYRCNTTIATGEAWNANHWDAQPVSYYLERMEQPITKPRFGVSGVGGSASALTRLWDAVGMTATPSTDTVAGSSDFDDHAPFNRRKCVGTWSAGDGKAVFTVKAYEGDADYAEDGSMGDYVAVDVTPFYYIEDGDIIGVSEQQFTGLEDSSRMRRSRREYQSTYLPSCLCPQQKGRKGCITSRLPESEWSLCHTLDCGADLQ